MNQEVPLKNNYDVSKDATYQSFENGTGATTDNVAYEVMGKIAYQSLWATFMNIQRLLICDVGCYLGGSSARWHQQGDGVVQVVGVDIHPMNIQKASATYLHVQNLSFRHMEASGPIPLHKGRLYHGMFATFVLDTIHSFEDVEQLCRNMVAALLPRGEIYLLRLHPNSLSYLGQFQQYRLQPKPIWSHGDLLSIELLNETRASIFIEDRYWEPEKVIDVFRLLGCEVELIDLSFHADEWVFKQLEIHIEKSGLVQNMPEWFVPLYQIMRVRKHHT